MNKYEPAVRWILEYINAHESNAVLVNDSEEIEGFNLDTEDDIKAAVDHATGSDEAVITVQDRFSLYLIYGNEIYELIADAGFRPEYEGNLDALCDAFSRQFEPEYYDALSSHPRKQEPENRPNTGNHHQP